MRGRPLVRLLGVVPRLDVGGPGASLAAAHNASAAGRASTGGGSDATRPAAFGAPREAAPSVDAPPAARAVELVAYLGLHRPDPVGSERLRSRVLGSEGRDAGAKTLFNLAAEARRALGPDAAGRPRLRRADGHGRYRLSGEVVVDAALLQAAAEGLPRGQREERPDGESLEALRGLLELVEGEPLAGVRRGYEWWSLEGHQAGVQRAAVSVACRLIELAMAAGESDLARWAIGRGRLVDPASELLSRAQMRLAAAHGDADELWGWQECCRRLGPEEAGPSRATEELFRRLAAELRARPSRGPARSGAEAGLAQASLAAIEEAPLSTVPSAPAAV